MKQLFLSLFFLISAAVSGNEILVANEGVGGNNTRHALNRIYECVLAYKPQWVIVEFGSNDANNMHALVGIDEYEKNLNLIIEKIRKNGTENIILSNLHPIIEEYLRQRSPKIPKDEDLNLKIKQYNEAVKRVSEQQKVALLDLHKFIESNGGAVETKESLLRNLANGQGKDGVHFTARGYELMAGQIYAMMKDKVKPGDQVICFGDSITYGANLRGAGTVAGQNYPSYLWKLLNPGKDSPSQLSSPLIALDGNLIFNHDFEYLDDNALPASWIFWKKNQDKAEIKSEGASSGNHYMQLTGSAKSKVMFRSRIIPQASGSYRFSCMARGKGELEIVSGVYGGKKSGPEYILQGKQTLTDAWQEIVLNLEIPAGFSRMTLIFQTTGQADVDNVKLYPANPEWKNTTELKNAHMRIRFASPENGGGIVDIENSKGVEFVNRQPDGSFWSMRLKKIKIDAENLPSIVNLACDPEQDDGQGLRNEDIHKSDIRLEASQAGGKAMVSRENNSVRFDWKGIKVGSEDNALDVWVQAELKPDDTFCLVDGGFVNRSREYTVFYFILPQLSGLGAIGNDPAKDFLATPFYNGRLINNPVEKDLLGNNRIFRANVSGHSLQCDALYNNGNGLYIATLDPDQYAKRYELSSSANRGVGWAVYNIPDNMRQVPQNWQVPYRSGFRTFQGDWYDACMIYRDWATKQFWCAEGPVATRKNIPQWFKDIDEWFQCSSTTSLEQLDKLVADFGNYKLGAWLTHWGLDNKTFFGMNPERFPLTQTDVKIMNYLKENKIPAMGYIQCTSWNDRTESFRQYPEADANMVRNYYGQKLRWPAPKDDKDRNEFIAYPGKLWRKVLGDAVVKMAENGFASAYMDSGNHGGTYMNFTPACSPESGGGTGYVKQNQELLRELRDRARQVNPDFCLNAESFWEGNIAHLDGFLVCNTTNAYLEGARVAPIPMAQAVYHDYTLMYSAWPGRGDVERDNARGFVAKHGLAFCWGVKPGWNILNLLYKYPNHEEVQRTSKLRYEGYSKSKKYLVYGRMLREPQTQEKVPTIPVKWHRGYGMNYFDIVMDKVFKSAWKIENGDFALVLYNIDEEAESLTLILDKKEYQLGKGKFSTVYPANLEYEATDTGDQYLVKINAPPRSPAILELVVR